MEEKKSDWKVMNVPNRDRLAAAPQSGYMPYVKELKDDSYYLSDEDVCKLLHIKKG